MTDQSNEIAESDHQRGYMRVRALKEAVKWCSSPGARPSDVVAAAVWFEDFLLNGEHYTRLDEDTPNSSARALDPPLGRDGEP